MTNSTLRLNACGNALGLYVEGQQPVGVVAELASRGCRGEEGRMLKTWCRLAIGRRRDGDRLLMIPVRDMTDAPKGWQYADAGSNPAYLNKYQQTGETGIELTRMKTVVINT